MHKKKNVLTFKNKKRTADTYTRTVLLLPSIACISPSFTFASNRSQLMRYADAALYEIKLHGKDGCMAYKEGLELRARTHPYHFFTTIWTFHADLPPISSDKISHYRDRYLIHVKRL